MSEDPPKRNQRTLLANPCPRIILPKWKGDSKDPHARDLVALIPFLEYIATMGIQDTRKVIGKPVSSRLDDFFSRH